MKIARVDNQEMAEFKNAITSVIYVVGCDLNCYYCHNDMLIKEDPGTYQEISPEELSGMIKWKAIDWVSLSGGEPLYSIQRPELVEFMKIVKHKDKLLNIDTNGHFMLPGYKKTSLGGMKEYVDCMSVDLKQMSYDHVSDTIQCLWAFGLLEKSRFRIVIMENNNINRYMDKRTARLLKSFNVDMVEMLPNSMGGRGKKYGPTSQERLKTIAEFYEMCGITFFQRKG